MWDVILKYKVEKDDTDALSDSEQQEKEKPSCLIFSNSVWKRKRLQKEKEEKRLRKPLMREEFMRKLVLDLRVVVSIERGRSDRTRYAYNIQKRTACPSLT
jgi:hypothetical protein